MMNHPCEYDLCKVYGCKQPGSKGCLGYPVKNKSMFKLHFTSFGHCSNPLPTLEAAKAEAKRCGFDCCVLKKKRHGWTTVGTWSIFNGYQDVVSDYQPKEWRVERSN